MQTFLLYIILVLVTTFFNENSRDKKNKIKINRLRGSLIIDYEKLKNLLEILFASLKIILSEANPVFKQNLLIKAF